MPGKDQIQDSVYEGMKILRDDFDCIDGNYFLLPTMEEMFGDDLLEERFIDMSEIEGNDAKDAAFYAKGPFSTELGYHADKNAFVLKVNALVLQDYMFELNQIDGDTIQFSVNNVDDGGKGFKIGNNSYSGFSDYCKKNNLGSTLEIRSAFINTPEIPHYEVQAIPKGTNAVKEMTFGEAKKLMDKTDVGGVAFQKFTKAGKSRKDSEKISLYETKSGGKKYYNEIISKNAPAGSVATRNPNYNYYTILAVDDTKKNLLSGGYKAQSIVKNQLKSGTKDKDIYVVLDASLITANKSTGDSYAFNNWWYTKEAIAGLIKDWKTSLNDMSFSNLDYSPYGTDKYGRFLGTVYLKKHTDDSWINLSKLILSDDETKTEHNPDYSGSPELESLGGNISDALQGWTYDKNNYKFVDLYADMQESYDKKIALHKEITGINFEERKDCTVMIGDVLLTIPPSSIRNTSVLTYEKQNILRGKGSMNKEQNREQMLELELYFYNQAGINGIPYTTTLPNGEEITYYMNGLRSLVAQFKVAPFLPIENGYINDILCIEAVSLESIQTINVEGFPGLVKVILTLRDFNYRVYMGDLPIDDEGLYNYTPPGKNDGDIKEEEEKKEQEKVEEEIEKNSTGKDYELDTEDISSLFVNMFAKTFDWELFRYYYQRAILKGETASTLDYGSTDYIDIIYDNKSVLQKANICKSDVSFYVPDPDWLEKALKVKKDKDQYKQSLSDVKLDQPSLKYMTGFSDIYDSLNTLNTITGIEDTENAPKFVKKYYDGVKKLFTSDLRATIGEKKDLIKNSSTNLSSPKMSEKEVSKIVTNIFYPVMTEIEKSANIANTTLDESITGKTGAGYTVKYTINCKLDESRLSSDQMQKVYEAIRNNGGADESSFKDGILKVTFSMKTDKDGKLIDTSDGINYGSTNGLTLDSDGGFSVLGNIKNSYNGKEDNSDGAIDQSTNDTQNLEMSESYQHYRNPKAMEFIPYVENAIATNFSITLQNTFTKMYLKSVDGYAPQYTGAEDTVIELQFVTNDSVITSLLNNLPAISSQTVKKYRRILASWPLRVKNDMLQLMGINEALVEQVEVSTVEDTPGLYEINMRLVSTDRTVREREALKKVGQGQTTDNDEYQIREYFDMDKILAKVDLYPDLDIPSLEELSEAGFEFSKYYLHNENDRSYPDPDFYMVYAYVYTSALLKKIVSEALYKNLHESGGDTSKPISQLAFEDVLGMKMISTIEDLKDPTTKTNSAKVSAKDANEAAKLATEYAEKANKDTTKKNDEEKVSNKNVEERKHDTKMRSILLYMLMCDVQKGWTIKNGWIATKCDESTNIALKEKVHGSVSIGKTDDSEKEETTDKTDEELKQEQKDREKVNAYVDEIKDRRQKAIVAIDNILSSKIEPIVGTGFGDDEYNESDLEVNYYGDMTPYIRAVNKLFSSEHGKELASLLCPLGTNEKVKENEFNELISGNKNKKDKFDVNHKDIFLRYISGFLYASACALSGAESYAPKKDDKKWQPRHFIENKKGTKIPIAKVKNGIKTDVYAKTYKDAFNNGVCIGPFLIKKYTRDELIEIFKHDPVFKMFPGNNKESYEHGAMYEKEAGKKIYRNGFMDRYYNHKGWESKLGKEYRVNCLSSVPYSAEAFLRIVLMHLRKLILEGVFISEIDIMAKDFSKIKDDLSMTFEEQLRIANVTDRIGGGIPDSLKNAMTQNELTESDGDESTSAEEDEQKNKIDKEVKEWFDKIIQKAPDAFMKSFCARMIYPFMSAITDADPAITEMILSEENATLDAITANPLIGQSKNSVFDKFMAALVGIHMFETKDKDADSNTSLSQLLMSSLGKTIFIAASNDPKQYVLHSYYDMLVNDKRGRLVRAFPTYYLLFVDEGREIGLWRLFDNFYSMSAIADMSITKSRKNPTDVCTLSMNNMFDSYSDTYSDATTQTYMDTYGVKDVFTSIFSPTEYMLKEDTLRKRQILPDTTVMKPGVRMHVRIGYGSDASKLPIVFNGKIAEVQNGDVMDIVAQGDGHELTNPLNVFGELEATALKEAQGLITLAKDLRGAFSRGGLHPRDLMAEILTAKHGGLLKTPARYFTKGQFFNDNPFGIYHFGDHRFKSIFELGEPVQNLFEVTNDNKPFDDSLQLDEYSAFGADSSYELNVPTINTTIQDKTAWQLLEMCANSGLDYIGAIRDFGLRSTVFLGRPNDYYAYAYKEVDDKILEKRKPFQQFHYYNSYSDIVYNNITASEAEMKTNAVGTWQQSDWLWGREQATVGPIYLDMNIYPEYQKSMTVDTGLVASGNGGIDINAIQRFLESTATSSSKGGRVNKPLAEMITTNCLKNSVKDMYTGELCIIGDPTVKPYDRVGLDDTYEDMSGMFEVESVIHNINADTGFTTTIIPDVIVKQNGSRETETLAYAKTFLYSVSLGVGSRLALNHFMARNDSKIIRAIAKSATMYRGSQATMSMFEKLSKASGLQKYITPDANGKVAWPRMKKFIEEDVKKLSLAFSAANRVSHSSQQVDELAKLLAKDKLTPSDIAKVYELSNSIDVDDYKKALEDLEKETKHPKAKKQIQELLTEIKNNPDSSIDINKIFFDKLEKNKSIDELIKNFDDAIKKVNDDKKTKELKELLEKIKRNKSDPDVMKDISKLITNDNIKHLDDDIFNYLDKFGREVLDVANDADGKKLVGLLDNFIKKGLSSDLLVDATILAKLNPATIAIEAAKMLFTYVFSSNVKAYFNSWLKSIQSLCVYPLDKNGRPLTAGMNGHKGSMMAYPPDDPYNSIQGMVIQTLEKIDSNIFGSLILGEFVDTDSMHQILDIYKSNLGIPTGEAAENIKQEEIIQNIQEDFSNECATRAYHFSAASSKYRIQSFDTNGGTSPEYEKYEIKVFRKEGESENDVPKNIGINERVLALYPIEDDPEIKKAVNGNHSNIKKLNIVHSKSDKFIQIHFESGIRNIRYTQGPGSKVYDMPMLQEDALFVLKRIIDNVNLKDKEVTFKSGVRVNSSKTWQNTGFRFLISSNSPDGLLNAVKAEKEATKFVNQLMFNYQDTGSGISICVYPPKNKVKKESEEEDK